MVSYGTSFQVTPLALLFMLVPLPPIRRYIKRQRLVEWVDRPDTEGGPFSKLDEQATLTVAPAAEPETDHDKVQDLLRRASYSANHLANRMENRTNTYLILGIAVGFVGLTVWYVSVAHLQGAGMKDILIQLVPRLTILVFIELLAGFFLQQYRNRCRGF